MPNKIALHKLGGILVTTLSVLVSGCQPSNQESQPLSDENKPKILATHSVLCDFITVIAEDTVDLTCLVEPGQDPHSYQPTPSQRQAMEQAQIIFYGGYELEPKIIQLIQATVNPGKKIPVYEAVVTEPLIGEHKHHEEASHQKDEHNHEDEHDHEDEHHEEETAELAADPHVWHDVKNAIAIVKYLQPELVELNPAQASLYEQNSLEYIEQLQRLDPWITEQIATIDETKRLLITTHDSLNYYVQAYGLGDYQSLQGLSTEDSPTAAGIKDLVSEIRQTGVPTIFAEAGGSDRVINNVAAEAGVKISDRKLLTDSIGKPGTDTDSYLKMMVNNTCAIVDGLGGKCQSF